ANSMLSYVNHEVRNPLNVIKGMVEYTLLTLEQCALPPELGTCVADLTVASRACDFLEHIVSDILVLQRLEAGALVLNPHPHRVSDIVEDMREAVRHKMEEKKNVVLIIECPTDITAVVDAFRLKQILLNFLSNSMKYTDQGSITVRVTKHDSGEITIGVLDTGSGIPETHQKLIFQAHVQLDADDVGRHGSHGLGLYLVSMLAQRMNWTVGFHSTVGVGSHF
ncbi:histidine kinase-like ATPase, partial [Tribonema minus]